MNQEKLAKIKAKCQEIIELGKKRIQGEWRNERTKSYEAGNYVLGPDQFIVCSLNYYDLKTAPFIAACAGTAEAMAKSTLIALDNLQLITDLGEYVAWDAINAILESWPDELL